MNMDAGPVIWLNEVTGDPVEYRFTFGLQFAREKHPLFPAAHPGGWLAVIARHEEIARAVAFAVLGPMWAFCYTAAAKTEAEWHQMFPLGELARVDASLAPREVK